MRRAGFIIALLLWAWPALGWAAVRIDFYSRDTDSRFPHAFVALTGTLDETGEQIDETWGFTVKGEFTPTLLAAPAAGVVRPVKETDPGISTLHFSLVLTDVEYRAVKALVAEWQALPQPSYDLHRRNCITFVAAVATRLGLDVTIPRGLEWKPKAFLASARRRNETVIAARAPPVAATVVSAGR